MKVYQRNQSFRKTTKQERMQKYYEHIQAKYSGRTSLKPPSKPQRKSPSPFPVSSGSVNGNMEGNDVELMRMMSLSTPKAPLQRIGNFSYPRKAWQSPELSSEATTAYRDVSKGHNYSFRNVPGPSESPNKYVKMFSGNSLPKWNQLYRAYRRSS